MCKSFFSLQQLLPCAENAHTSATSNCIKWHFTKCFAQRLEHQSQAMALHWFQCFNTKFKLNATWDRISDCFRWQMKTDVWMTFEVTKHVSKCVHQFLDGRWRYVFRACISIGCLNNRINGMNIFRIKHWNKMMNENHEKILPLIKNAIVLICFIGGILCDFM